MKKWHTDLTILEVAYALTIGYVSFHYFDGWGTFAVCLIGIVIATVLLTAYLWVKKTQEPT